MTATHPASDGLVAASADLEVRVGALVDRLVRRARETLGTRLRAVVLGGSLARGEGVSVLGPDGSPALVSDIDLYLVVSELKDQESLGNELRAMVAECPHVLPPLDVGFVVPGHFARIEGTVPGAQLAHAHRVLFAAPGFELRVPPTAAVAVDPNDSLKLLHNRLAENLLARGRGDVAAAFHDWKLWIDAPLALVSAVGRYSPERDRQLEELEALADQCPPPSRRALRAGVALGRQLVRRMRSQPLPPDDLRSMMRPDGPGVPSLTQWVELLYPAVLARALGQSTASALSRVGDGAAVGDLQGAWLRRRTPWSTLREARRWAPLAKMPISPWWRHGWTGTGPDRVYVAAARRWLGHPQWASPLRSLVPGDLPPNEPDEWVGEMWSRWIMGGNRS